MSTLEVAKAFDIVATAYDATREPADPATIDAVAAVLRARGARRLLEVGVGTGRISLALAARGFELVGADVSRGMLARARSKGVDRLVRAVASRLPFPSGAFDAVLFVHVLHLLDDPRRALREAVRVGRLGAFALLRPTDGRRDPIEGSALNPRRIVYDRLAREGYPRRGRGLGPGPRERRLLAEEPPDELLVVAEADVTEPLARRLDLLANGASRHVVGIPPDVLARAVAEAREAVGDRTVRYHRVDALAVWNTSLVRRRRASPPKGRRLTSRSGAPSRTGARRRRGSSRARSPNGSGTSPRTVLSRRPARSPPRRSTRRGRGRPPTGS